MSLLLCLLSCFTPFFKHVTEFLRFPAFSRINYPDFRVRVTEEVLELYQESDRTLDWCL
jgi:hypothetical protein